MADKRVSPLLILKSIYNNEFQWAFIKSVAMFALGVRIAKEFVGVELMTPVH